MGLKAGQIGGTDVTGAQLPKDMQDFDDALDHATQASKSARGLFITLLIACFYCLITIGTTTDALRKIEGCFRISTNCLIRYIASRILFWAI